MALCFFQVLVVKILKLHHDFGFRLKIIRNLSKDSIIHVDFVKFAY